MQVGCYDSSVFQVFDVVYDGIIIFNLDISFQMYQFVDMYELVFENSFVNGGYIVGYVVDCYELGLYIGWKSWIWCCMQIDCFQVFWCNQMNGVVFNSDFVVCIYQFVDYGVQIGSGGF